ncbi:MAG: amidohydrolase family protein, partial [Pseudomonadota bacterium]
DDHSVVELILNRANAAGFARVLPLGAMTRQLQGEQLAEAATLIREGCVGLSNASEAIRDTRVLRRAFEYAATFEIPVLLQPQDPWLSASACAHEGAVATRLGLPGIPVSAETVSIAQMIELTVQTGAHVHLSRLSSRRGVQMLQEAKRDGLPITGDVSINHLHLCDIDISGFNSLCHTLPPLRDQRDRDALREAIVNGTLDAVCSDHNPCEFDAKMAPFEATHAGISGVETLLPLLMRLTDDGLDLPSCLGLATAGPARVLKLNLGSLQVGASADVCIIDPDVEWEVTRHDLQSQGKNSPYEGWMLRGKARHTLVGGRIIES